MVMFEYLVSLKNYNKCLFPLFTGDTIKKRLISYCIQYKQEACNSKNNSPNAAVRKIVARGMVCSMTQ